MKNLVLLPIVLILLANCSLSPEAQLANDIYGAWKVLKYIDYTGKEEAYPDLMYIKTNFIGTNEYYYYYYCYMYVLFNSNSIGSEIDGQPICKFNTNVSKIAPDKYWSSDSYSNNTLFLNGASYFENRYKCVSSNIIILFSLFNDYGYYKIDIDSNYTLTYLSNSGSRTNFNKLIILEKDYSY